jgi:hypothetical protein
MEDKKIELLKNLFGEIFEYNDCLEKSMIQEYGNFEIIGPYIDANKKFKKRFESIINNGEDLNIPMDL